MLRFLTAGESHGKAEVAILEGIPAGLTLEYTDIQKELDKRRGGLGRGGRGLIETDRVEILSGVRLGKTLGSPIALIIRNLDHKNWTEIMTSRENKQETINNPRPGHADFAGMLKYGFCDARDVIERASARETVMRVGVGAICKKLLSEFGINISSKIMQIGKVRWHQTLNAQELEEIIKEATKRKDTLGGIIEVMAINVPVGLGSFMHWDLRLDGRIAQAMMSIPSVKALEIGEGIKNASLPGSQVHDEIFFKKRFFRKTNSAGGIEGGMSNGENIVIRVFFKPIATVGASLRTVDLKSKKETRAHTERSDICVVPRAGVITESMLAFVLVNAFLEKFGGDSIVEIKKNYDNYKNYIENI